VREVKVRVVKTREPKERRVKACAPAVACTTCGPAATAAPANAIAPAPPVPGK
jgi:3-oxoacyl-ACP reductase-like protein